MGILFFFSLFIYSFPLSGSHLVTKLKPVQADAPVVKKSAPKSTTSQPDSPLVKIKAAASSVASSVKSVLSKSTLFSSAPRYLTKPAPDATPVKPVVDIQQLVPETMQKKPIGVDVVPRPLVEITAPRPLAEIQKPIAEVTLAEIVVRPLQPDIAQQDPLFKTSIQKTIKDYSEKGSLVRTVHDSNRVQQLIDDAAFFYKKAASGYAESTMTPYLEKPLSDLTLEEAGMVRAWQLHKIETPVPKAKSPSTIESVRAWANERLSSLKRLKNEVISSLRKGLKGSSGDESLRLLEFTANESGDIVAGAEAAFPKPEVGESPQQYKKKAESWWANAKTRMQAWWNSLPKLPTLKNPFDITEKAGADDF